MKNHFAKGQGTACGSSYNVEGLSAVNDKARVDCEACKRTFYWRTHETALAA